jgi:hypothetical protein
MTAALRGRASLGAGAIAILLTAACSWAPSDFAKQASDAASTLSAAQSTIRLRHDGRLTQAYAQGAFANYREVLQGVDQELTHSSGAPDAQEVARLVALFHEAEGALENPCLDNRCDWASQEAALKRAADAFTKAAGG